MTGSASGKSGDTQICGCRLSYRRKDESCTSTSSVSNPDLDSDSDLDLDLDLGLGLVVLVFRPAFWAVVILLRLFSNATTLVN